MLNKYILCVLKKQVLVEKNILKNEQGKIKKYGKNGFLLLL
jgi:hypothetical protein